MYNIHSRKRVVDLYSDRAANSEKSLSAEFAVADNETER